MGSTLDIDNIMTLSQSYTTQIRAKWLKLCLSLPDESKIAEMLELTGPKPFEA
jgi:hypothetical protein